LKRLGATKAWATLLIHVGAFHLSSIFRFLLGAGTPRELRNRLARLMQQLFGLLGRLQTPTVRAKSDLSPLALKFQPNRPPSSI
jgi:hypothetical protein